MHGQHFPHYLILIFILTHAYSSGSSSSTTAQQVVSNDDQPELFERIEATKLQEAVSNASAMGQLQVR